MTTFTESITARNDQQTDMLEAIALVYEHTSDNWKTKANQAVRSLCVSEKTFTADDVLEMLQDEPCHDLRALGAVMQNAARAGLCRATGQYVKSRLPQRHKRPVAEWESLPPRA